MKKTEVQGIYKERDGILINKDNEGLAAYKKQKLQANRLNKLEDALESTQKDLSEIKSLLQEVLSKWH